MYHFDITYTDNFALEIISKGDGATFTRH